MSFSASIYRHHGWGITGSYLVSILIISLFFLTSSQTFQYLGFSPYFATMVLFLSVVASSINIPIKIIESNRPEIENIPIRIFGITYLIPAYSRKNRTLIAINVGGAIIPILIAILLFLLHPQAILLSLPAILITAIIVNYYARPVEGLGIAIPMYIPMFASVILSIVLTTGNPVLAPVVAYASGTLGSLIGADLWNIRKIPDLGAPIASIGGAGTFDGIFLSGIFSVALLVLFGYY